MKKPDYAKLLSDYPLSQKIFADTEPDFDAADAPLPDSNPEDPVPIVEPGAPGTEEESEEVPLFDPQQIKEDVRRNLAQWMEEDLKVGEDEYKLLIDSYGEPEAAAAELKLGEEMASSEPDFVEWVISQGNGLVKDLAAEAELPGSFEFELDEEADEESDEEVIPTIDLVFKFNKADLDQLLGEGFALMQEGQEEEPSFDDIMSSLVQAGHEDVARRIYDIIYPTRKH